MTSQYKVWKEHLANSVLYQKSKNIHLFGLFKIKSSCSKMTNEKSELFHVEKLNVVHREASTQPKHVTYKDWKLNYDAQKILSSAKLSSSGCWCRERCFLSETHLHICSWVDRSHTPQSALWRCSCTHPDTPGPLCNPPQSSVWPPRVCRWSASKSHSGSVFEDSCWL